MLELWSEFVLMFIVCPLLCWAVAKVEGFRREREKLRDALEDVEVALVACESYEVSIKTLIEAAKTEGQVTRSLIDTCKKHAELAEKLLKEGER